MRKYFEPTREGETLGSALNHFMDIQPDEILQFFAYEHLPPHLQEVSKPFGEMAKLITQAIPRNAERDMALRKLLESKDCAVRAVLFK